MPKSKQFKEILKNVRKTYLGKSVPLEYRNRYGKIYDKDEIESIAFAIAKKNRIKIDGGIK